MNYYLIFVLLQQNGFNLQSPPIGFHDQETCNAVAMSTIKSMESLKKETMAGKVMYLCVPEKMPEQAASEGLAI